jgi:hypothetical protein
MAARYSQPAPRFPVICFRQLSMKLACTALSSSPRGALTARVAAELSSCGLEASEGWRAGARGAPGLARGLAICVDFGRQPQVLVSSSSAKRMILGVIPGSDKNGNASLCFGRSSSEIESRGASRERARS